jgi:hypothetical protein
VSKDRCLASHEAKTPTCCGMCTRPAVTCRARSLTQLRTIRGRVTRPSFSLSKALTRRLLLRRGLRLPTRAVLTISALDISAPRHFVAQHRADELQLLLQITANWHAKQLLCGTGEAASLLACSPPPSLLVEYSTYRTPPTVHHL